MLSDFKYSHSLNRSHFKVLARAKSGDIEEFLFQHGVLFTEYTNTKYAMYKMYASPTKVLRKPG